MPLAGVVAPAGAETCRRPEPVIEPPVSLLLEYFLSALIAAVLSPSTRYPVLRNPAAMPLIDK